MRLKIGTLIYFESQQIPHCFQQTMLSEATPVLSRAITHFEMLMTDWEDLAKQYKLLEPWINIGLQWATKYYIRMDDTEAYVITMCKYWNRIVF